MPSTKDIPTQSPDAEQETVLDEKQLHQLLMQVSQEEASDVAGREAAIAKNRARAMDLLAALEKSLG